jgi:hypothetical protein
MSAQVSFGEQRLGWHWLWFIPLCLLVLLVVELHAVHLVLAALKLGRQRWDWGGLFSPSAWLCANILWFSVVAPLVGLAAIAFLVKSRNEFNTKQRWLYSVLLVIVIFVFPFVTDALISGSFPFIIDDDGVSRLRMIPFIPWPSGDVGTY